MIETFLSHLKYKLHIFFVKKQQYQEQMKYKSYVLMGTKKEAADLIAHTLASMAYKAKNCISI